MVLRLPELIENACSPARHQPNMALNLEICERINGQGGTAPRTAALTIVQYINSSHRQQALLSLTLLDSCVKNCGYPFHIQIANKEFLNKFVRKFPDQPPVRYAPSAQHSAPENTWDHAIYAPRSSSSNAVIDRILYLIKLWNIALVDISRHKKDLAYINDMYRLLRYKGYKFPDILDSSIAALAPEESLKSAEELEEEDQIAQKAKLQELIRRGRPADLVEANRLVKILSGYDSRKKSSYGERFMEELHKIKNKAIILSEMLDNAEEDASFQDNRFIMELKGVCKSALPKIERMIAAEKEEERRDELLEVNKMIQSVLERANQLHGTTLEASEPPVEKKDIATPSQQPISLIDLDDEPDIAPRSNPTTGLDELSQLFGDSSLMTSQPDVETGHVLDWLVDSQHQRYTAHSPSSSLPLALTTPPTMNAEDSTLQHSTASTTLLDKNGLHIAMDVTTKDTEYHLTVYFSNRSTAPMEKVVLHLAAPKTMILQMDPPSDRTIPAKSDRAIWQKVSLMNPSKQPLRLRYKVTYDQFDAEMEQTGDYHA